MIFTYLPNFYGYLPIYYQMASEKQIAEIVMLRGLGYNQKEIAGKLGLTQSTVWYNLNEVREKANEKGDTSTFISVLVEGFMPEIVEKAKLLDKLV
jgi:predicted transcriptional regulator